MRFHYIGQVFDTCENTAELIKIFDFDNDIQVCETAIDIHGNIGNIDAFT